MLSACLILLANQHFVAAANEYNIPLSVFLAVAKVESQCGTLTTALVPNKNGTKDRGVFQINSVHINTTCTEFKIKTFKGNALCAAKLLDKARSSSDPLWIGRYHSKTPQFKKRYMTKINKALLEINYGQSYSLQE